MWLPGRCGGRQCSECSSFPSLGLSRMGLNVLREWAGMGARLRRAVRRTASMQGRNGAAGAGWRRLGAPADYPCPEQGPVLGPGGRWLESGSGAEQHRRGCWPATLQAAWAGQARDQPASPGAVSPSAAGSARSAGVPGVRLPEPGLQGAQLRVVQALAQPVRLLGGQAQRVAGQAGWPASSWASASNPSANGRYPEVPVASISASAARIRCSPRRGSPLRASAHPRRNGGAIPHCRNPCLPMSAACSVAESRTRVTSSEWWLPRRRRTGRRPG